MNFKKIKLIIVTFLLLPFLAVLTLSGRGFFDLLFVNEMVGAATDQGEPMYKYFAEPGAVTNVGTYDAKRGFGMGIDAGIKLVCGGQTNKELIFNQIEPCIPSIPNSDIALQNGAMPGGFAALAAISAGYVIDEASPPTNLAMFFDDAVNDNLFNEEIYAASGRFSTEPAEWFQGLSFDLWKFSRNLALALSGLFLAVAALGIMFRQKISPQVNVTISNVLPYVPIALLGIVLSYPIVAIAANMVPVLNDITRDLANTVIDQLAGDVAYANRDFYGLLVLVTGAIVAAVTYFNVFSLALMIVIIAMIGIVTFLTFKYFWELFKTYALFVLYVVAMPFVCVIAILPGKQGIIVPFLKKLGVNVLVMPIMNLIVFIGFGVLLTMGTKTGSDYGSTLQNIGIGGFVVPVAKFIIGVMLIWNGLKTRSNLESWLGASGSLMSIVKPEEQRR